MHTALVKPSRLAIARSFRGNSKHARPRSWEERRLLIEAANARAARNLRPPLAGEAEPIAARGLEVMVGDGEDESLVDPGLEGVVIVFSRGGPIRAGQGTFVYARDIAGARLNFLD